MYVRKPQEVSNWKNLATKTIDQATFKKNESNIKKIKFHGNYPQTDAKALFVYPLIWILNVFCVEIFFTWSVSPYLNK